MNSIRSILFSSLLVLILSCQKDDNSPIANVGLVGKWKLTESLNDPGGGATWRKMDEYSSSIIEFKANGDFSEKKGVIYSSINPYNRYKILDDGKIQLSIKDSVSNPLKTIWSYSDLTPSNVILSYGCFEACSGKYVSVK